MSTTLPEPILTELIETRRDLHMHPEVAFTEVRTAGIAAERLRALGFEVREGIAKTGVVGILRGGHPGKTILVRADMDCLPVTEANEVPYKSLNDGFMHACGHDGHTSIALAAARVLAGRRDRLHGTVKFVFQPAEEGPGGAKPMIEAGVMEDPRVDACIGLHLWNDLPSGVVGIAEGPLMAATGEWRATIVGKGGHGAAPHATIDPIVAAAHCVTALQSIVARNVDPLKAGVVTVGEFHAGQAFNIIAHEAKLSGTIRSFDDEVHALLERRLAEVLDHVSAGLGATALIDYRRGYPVLRNDAAMCDVVRSAAAEVVGEENVVRATPTLGGEDMAYFLREAPGCFFFVGSASPDEHVYPHHNPRFNIDEAALPVGVQVMVRAVEKYLANPA
jgi:amidohydrolase